MKKKLVFVVDDELTIALTTALVINLIDSDVMAVHLTTVGDLKVAVSGVRPDLILLDVYLPDADGIEHALELRDKMRIKVILMSGAPEATELVAGLMTRNINPFPMLPKPISPAILVSKIQGLLGTENSSCT